MKLLALLLVLAAVALPARADGPDEETKVKMVQYMLKTPMNEADPTIVSGFMKIDPDTLPKKWRDKARGKQMEVDSVVKIHSGKKKGPFRFPDNKCAAKKYGPEGLPIMAMIIGNAEIESEEADYLEKRTDCSEDQLICEFTLNVVIIPRKGKPALRRYYLMEQDPLMAYLAEYRAGSKGGKNNYFQELKPTCQKPAGG